MSKAYFSSFLCVNFEVFISACYFILWVLHGDIICFTLSISNVFIGSLKFIFNGHMFKHFQTMLISCDFLLCMNGMIWHQYTLFATLYICKDSKVFTTFNMYRIVCEND